MNRLERVSELWRVGRRFGPQLAPHRQGLLALFVLGLAGALLEIAKPWPLKWIIDDVLMVADSIESPAKLVVLGAAVAFAVAAAKAAVDYRMTVRTKEVGHALTRGLRHALFAHLVLLSPSFHARNKSGDLLVRLMGDVPMVRAMLVDSAVDLALRMALIVGMVAVMLGVEWQLTLIVLALVPFFAWFVRWLSGHITIAVRKQRRKEGALADYLHEAIEAAPVLQSLDGGTHVVRRFARNNRRSARAGLKAARLAARLSASVEGGLALAVAITLAAGGIRVTEGDLKLGELILFLSYVRSLLKPVRSASRHAERIAKGIACSERVLAVLETAPAVRTGTNPQAALNEPPSELCYDDVYYGYDEGSTALAGFSATFGRGELVGLAGPNGAGKSTAAMLAVRLDDPRSGSIRLDGTDIKRLELSELRAQVGVALQTACLFGDTIRENLIVAAPEASEEELLEACRMAGFDTVLAKLPDGLDSELGRSGQGLSGGERARLSLARTLLRRTPVILVDEPLAGLDRNTAARVLDRLRHLAETRIVVVIAHDPEHLASFDRVVTLEQGRTQDTANGSEPTLPFGVGRESR